MSSSRTRPKISKEQFTLSGDRIFFSLQGEGPSIGQPAVFMRLHLCNLSCSWCDTPYTWDESSPAFWNEWKQFSIIEIADQLGIYPCRRLVITGGEPLLQQDAISQLLEHLGDWEIEIETNGTIIPNQIISERCNFNVSPKLTNSNLPLDKRIRADVIKHYLGIERAFFKFVVSNSEDLDEVKGISEQFAILPSKIVIMPEGTSDTVIKERMQELAEKTRDYGFRLLPRLHVQIWGNKRAV